MKSLTQYRGVTSTRVSMYNFTIVPPRPPKNSTCISIELRFVVLHSPAYSIQPPPSLARCGDKYKYFIFNRACSLIAVIVVTLINHSSSHVTQWPGNSQF